MSLSIKNKITRWRKERGYRSFANKRLRWEEAIASTLNVANSYLSMFTLEKTMLLPFKEGRFKQKS